MGGEGAVLAWLGPLLKLLSWLGQALFAWKAGRDNVRADTAEKTVETIDRVTAPISNAERDELWARNSAKYGPVQRDPGA